MTQSQTKLEKQSEDIRLTDELLSVSQQESQDEITQLLVRDNASWQYQDDT